jgi:hypothetical protein
MKRSWKWRTVATVAVVLAGWAAVAAQDKKDPDKPAAKGAADDSAVLAARLAGRVTVEKSDDIPLKDAVEFLSEKGELTILIDYAAFARSPGLGGMEACQDPAGIAERTVKLPKVRNVRLGTVLRTILSQIDGAYLIYPDHLKVTTVQQMALETGQKLYTPDMAEEPVDDPYKVIRVTPLINVAAKEQPLREVVREIAEATGANVVLAPQAGEKGQAPITAKLFNTPLPDGARVLAEMAGLKTVSAGNAILVTTPAHAAEWLKEDAAKKPQPAWGGLCGTGPFGGLGGLGGGLGGIGNGGGWAPMGGQPVDPNQFVELQKKVADLEKKLAEAQQPKK